MEIEDKILKEIDVGKIMKNIESKISQEIMAYGLRRWNGDRIKGITIDESAKQDVMELMEWDEDLWQKYTYQINSKTQSQEKSQEDNNSELPSHRFSG